MHACDVMWCNHVCRWSLIAGRLPGRTDNEIKNYWNTNISKRVHNDQVQGRDNNLNLVCGRGRGRTHHPHRNPPPTKSQESAKKNLSSGSSNINNKSQKVHSNNTGPSSSIREGSYVVRTKASRCTKVFINTQVDQIPGTTTTTINNNMEIMKAPSISNTISTTTTTTPADHIDATTQPLLLPTFLREDDINNISSADHQLGLMEEDEKFLSEFLSSTTTPFDDFDDLGFADINLLLPTSDVDHILQNVETEEEEEKEVHEQQNYSDELGSMASLLDPALDWLHDE